MITAVQYLTNTASETQIAKHLMRCDTDFMPPLSDRVAISDYAQKIAHKAMRFEAWSGGALVGLAAAYCNDQENHIAHVTSVSVLREWKGKGIARNLMQQCIEYAKASGMKQVSLEVANDNMRAINLYEKNGFVAAKAETLFVTMNLFLKNGEEHEQQA